MFVLINVLWLAGCKETFAPIGESQEVIVPFSIVSVFQNAGSSAGSIQLKLPKNFTEDFKIILTSKTGTSIALNAGTIEVIANFNLRNYTVSQLNTGEDYTLTLNYKDEQKNTITTSRHFIAKQTSTWKMLAHAPINSGDYTGAALLSPLFNSQIAIYRYQNDIKWDVLKYDGKWLSSESSLPLPRHNAVAFPLGQEGGRELVFVGFGYLTDENLPDKRAYLNDFWWVPSISYVGQSAGVVFPTFSGVDRRVKFFLTFDNVFMLKEDFTGAMESMDVTWDRKDRQPLPEQTGKLATFTISGIGYVINQISGQSPHVYSYDPAMDKWERKADFPGIARVEGSGFSANGKGYFGLGIDKDGNGLRDLWAYDPSKNSWTYHSDYPGQGNRYLIALSDKTKAYLGWGYETRATEGSVVKQQIGCTDFWEFNP
ncbi:kelch repeat-containing protein [Dyadobacter frigoris]|uniref:kelch repeat-containing protein n=1 Tax=Dyadobacter frigoris TaxID=2576211 RepID=UPI001484DB6F|nr:kelch repeat-containing protein [Dyadobacter frigoris]